MDSIEERINELESRLTFQDDLVQTLDGVIIKQQNEIDEIKVQLKHLSQQLAQETGPDSLTEDEPPPHY